MLTEPNLVTDAVATDEEQARLGLFPGEMIYRLNRIRGQGDDLLVETIRLPAALFPRLKIPVPCISDLAHTYGLKIGEAVERVCAVATSGDIAKVLGVTEATLVLTLDRVVHLRDGRPAEWRIAYGLDHGNLAKLKDRLGL
jgi:DNA-binding GntR family transcriptional regulator